MLKDSADTTEAAHMAADTNEAAHTAAEAASEATYATDPPPASSETAPFSNAQPPPTYFTGDAPYLKVVKPRMWSHVQGDTQPEAARDAVRDAIKHSWDAYVRFAWGADELMPLSRSGRTTFGDTGITIVDSIDTLLVAGLQDEALKCVV